MYKYEMHLHSCFTSACAVSQTVDYIKAAKEHGYAGFVLTNHFFRGNSAIDRRLPWREFAAPYCEEYYRTREVGEREGIDVIFGLEEGYGNGKECLIYGLSPELIMETEELSVMNIAGISDFVRKNGGFIACAHPFRQRAYITSPDEEPNPGLFDAVEVYNRGNSLEDNIKAEKYAEKYSMQVISGGDVHNVTNFGSTGVAFPERARNGAELVKLLRDGKYRLLANKELGNSGQLFEYE